MIQVEFIDIPSGRRAPSSPVVERFAASMKQIGLRTPITVRYFPERASTDAESLDRYVLVVGGHRLAAAKLLGWEEIEAFVIDGDDVKESDVELWEIDENLMRNELDAAEHALLTKRRAAIVENREKAQEQEAALVSQPGTSIKKQRGGRAGVAGKAAASIRDQAEKTGESKSKVARSKKRGDKLDDDILLYRVSGTPLGTGAQLDALMKLDAEKRERLVKQLEAGEDVSAVRALATEAALRSG